MSQRIRSLSLNQIGRYNKLDVFACMHKLSQLVFFFYFSKSIYDEFNKAVCVNMNQTKQKNKYKLYKPD